MNPDDQDVFVDDEMEPDPSLNEWTNRIIGAAIVVHRAIGPGYNESVYERAMAIEFDLQGIPFVQQAEITVMFKGQEVGKGWVDFLVADKVMVDLKSIESLGPIQSAQMISYLDATGHLLGLLINFNVRLLKDGIKRIAGGQRNPHRKRY